MSTPIRLLIIEDCSRKADLMLDELRQAGFSPQAERVETEADFVRQLDLPHNLVLAEYNLPFLDTFRALELVQSKGLDLPLIVLVDRQNAENAIECLRRGAADCIFKDQLVQLPPSVTRVLEQKRLRDQKRWSDQGLRNSERRFRSLIENSSDGIALVDADATIVYLNPTVLRITGYPAEEVVGRHLLDFVHEEDTEHIRARITQVIQQPAAQESFLGRFRHKNGEWLWVECTATNLVAEPCVHAILLSYRDVSERKRAEDALRTNEDRYRDLVESSPMMIVTHDLEGRILTANPATVQALSRVSTNHPVSNIRDLVLPRYLDQVDAYLGEIQNSQEATGLLSVSTDDGQEHILEFHSSLRTEGLTVPTVRAVVRNVTETRRAERARKQMTREIKALYETLLQITQQTDLETLLPIIVQRAADLLGARMGALYLVRDEKQTVELVVSHHLPGDLTGTVLGMGEGLSGRVAQSGQPLMVEDYSHWEGRAAVFADLPFRRALSVPLKIQDRVVGVLNLTDDDKTNPYSEDEIRLASLFADQAAIAIGNARLLDETRQRASELGALYETTNDLATQHELPGLLQTIVERAVQLMGTSSGRILLYDPVRHDLEVAAAIKSNTPIGYRMRMGEGVAGQVALTRQPLIVNDYPAWEGRVPYYTFASLNAVIGIPMVYGGELIGVLTVTETRGTPRQFSDRDVRLLSLFATQAASAVDNARLFEQTNNRAEQLGLLYDAGLTLNRMLDPHAVMRFLLTIAAKTVHGDRVDFFRYDSRRQTLYFEAGSGYAREADISSLRAMPMPLGEERGLVGRVALERVPLYLPDVRADPRWIPFDPLVRSALLAPIVREDELRGVVTVGSTREDAFSPADQRLVALFANQLSVAMENARLFEQTRQRAEQLTVVNRIAEAVNRTMTLNSLLELIYKEISASLRFEAFFIALYDAPTDEVDFRIKVDRGTREIPRRAPRSSAPLTSVVIETRQPLLIRDWERESAHLPAPYLYGTMLIPSSFLGVPMKIGDAVVGVIAVQSYTTNAYSEDDEQLLTTISDQIAVAIEKARLFEAERRGRQELTALYDLSRALTDEQNFDSILNLVVRHSVQVAHVSFARIALVDGDEMVVRAVFPVRALECDLQLGRREPIATHPICLNAMQNSVPVVIRLDDPALTERERDSCFLGIAKHLCIVPLRAGDRNFGVLMLGEARHESREPFSPEKLHLAYSIGDQTASALARASLREQSGRATAELASAYDATIEGWARALEMRDQEAHGHTQRVSELAVYVARALHVPDPELTHIRRGALLHDIGKMAIPDSILFKPDPLTAEEEKIMRQHPERAQALLDPIAYLRPALDIPYCHHEKWDGTGYPRGLKGEQIPLAARVFAIADVWDAMRSPRLYRAAWSEEAALEYVQAQAGKHFDPEIVKVFLNPRTFAFYRTLS